MIPGLGYKELSISVGLDRPTSGQVPSAVDSQVDLLNYSRGLLWLVRRLDKLVFGTLPHVSIGLTTKLVLDGKLDEKKKQQLLFLHVPRLTPLPVAFIRDDSVG